MPAQQQTQSQSQSQPQSQTQTQSQSQIQPHGNQAALADAGLAGDGVTDTSMAGPFAGLLLDVMALEQAIDVGLDHRDNPAVQGWLAALDPAVVTTTLAAAPTLWSRVLALLWPVDLGLCVEGALGGTVLAGAELGVETTVWHRAGGVFSVHQAPRLHVDAGVAGGAVMTDAFGHGTEAKAEASTGLDIDLDVNAAACLSPHDWCLALQLGPGHLWRRVVLGDAQPVQPDVAPVEPLLSLDIDTVVSWSAQVEGRLQVEDIDVLPAPVREVVLDTIGGVDLDLMAATSGCAGLSASWLPFVDNRGVLRLEGRGDVMAAAAGSVGLIASGVDVLALQAAAGAGGALTVAVELDLMPAVAPGEPASLLATSFEVERTAQSGGASASSSLCFESLAAAASALCSTAAPPGESVALAQLLDAGPAPTVSLSLAQDLEPEALLAQLPDWMAALPGMPVVAAGETTHVLSSDSELRLCGSFVVTPDDFVVLADAGLRVPGGSSRAGAFQAVADAVVAASSHQPLPGWATAAEGAIGGLVDANGGWTNPTVQGFVGVGVGGAASGAVLAEAGAKARTTVRVTIDRPAPDQLVARLDGVAAAVAP